MRRAVALGASLLLPGLVAGVARGGEVHVAVVQNFARTCRELGDAFAADSGHATVLSAGSTGKLYAQIRNGAPFEVFLSADAERPTLLEKAGLAEAGTRFTYALGRLVLWSPRADLVDADGTVLAGDGFRHLALANPAIAPYGAAAREVLLRRDLWQRLQPKLVLGEDIGQTYQFIATGNAELGFVALSQVRDAGEGSRWVVPQELHSPLEQQAVLLVPGRQDEAARAFLDFLRGAPARALIERAGYASPSGTP
jgi:molybdate transport system substrate-binding protein